MAWPFSFVYLIRDGDVHKIGTSARPESRLSQVASSEGVIVHTFRSRLPFAIERALHRRFASSHVPGLGREWFNLTDEDVAAICQLDRVDSVKQLPLMLQPPPPRVTLYAQVPTRLKRRLDRLAKFHKRKINAELEILLERYLSAEEVKEGLSHQ